jgi:hypothetical protein
MSINQNNILRTPNLQHRNSYFLYAAWNSACHGPFTVWWTIDNRQPCIDSQKHLPALFYCYNSTVEICSSILSDKLSVTSKFKFSSSKMYQMLFKLLFMGKYKRSNICLNARLCGVLRLTINKFKIWNQHYFSPLTQRCYLHTDNSVSHLIPTQVYELCPRQYKY